MDALDRLHRRLVEAVQRASPSPLDRSLTVADIYQHLVPYRLVRGELAFSELKEYEHALLRLLSGERDYLRVELEQVAEEFRRELRSPNPILGIYRDYAAVGVSLNSGSTAQSGAPPAPPKEAKSQAPPTNETPPAKAAEPEAEPEPEPEPAQTVRSASETTGVEGNGAEVSAGSAASCWSCREALPTDREVRFCPHCGTNQLSIPCAECGTLLDVKWRFCISCGARKPESAASAA